MGYFDDVSAAFTGGVTDANPSSLTAVQVYNSHRSAAISAYGYAGSEPAMSVTFGSSLIDAWGKMAARAALSSVGALGGVDPIYNARDRLAQEGPDLLRVGAVQGTAQGIATLGASETYSLWRLVWNVATAIDGVAALPSAAASLGDSVVETAKDEAGAVVGAGADLLSMLKNAAKDIAGGIAGAIAPIALVALGVYFLARRR